MGIRQKIRTFTTLLRARPASLWELIQIRIERSSGVPLYFLSARRLATRVFELLRTRPLDGALVAYGNYFLDPSKVGAHPVVFSIGVGQHIDFDRALIERHDVTLHLIDPTPTSKAYVEGAKLPANVTFHPVAISSRDGEMEMYIDDMESDFQRASSISMFNRGVGTKSFTVQCRRVTTLMAECKVDSIDVLKLDVEGAAIMVLNDVLDQGVHPRQIACEFERPESVSDVVRYLRDLSALFERLNNLGYEIYRTRELDLGCQVEVVAIRSSA